MDFDAAEDREDLSSHRGGMSEPSRKLLTPAK